MKWVKLKFALLHLNEKVFDFIDPHEYDYKIQESFHDVETLNKFYTYLSLQIISIRLIFVGFFWTPQVKSTPFSLKF